MFYILILFSLFGNIYAGESGKSFTSKEEPTHYLIFKSKYNGKPITLRREPSLLAPVYKEVFIDETKYWDAEKFIKFDNKKARMPLHETSAIDHKNNFFKVFFENEYLWVLGSDFKEILSITEYFSSQKFGDKGFSINYRKAQLFTSEFEPISIKDFRKKIPKKDIFQSNFIFTIKKVERRNGEVWLLGNVCCIAASHDNGLPCENYLKGIYLKPYDGNGEAVGWAFNYPKR